MTNNNINNNNNRPNIMLRISGLFGRGRTPVKQPNILEIAVVKGKQKAEADELALAVENGIKMARSQAVAEATPTAHDNPHNEDIYVRPMTDRQLGLEGGASDNSVVTTRIRNATTLNPDNEEIYVPPMTNQELGLKENYTPTLPLNSKQEIFSQQQAFKNTRSHKKQNQQINRAN